MLQSNEGAQWGQGEFRGGEPGVAVISGATFGPREVSYSRIDGLAIFEGDIVLGVADDLEQALEKHRARTRAGNDDGGDDEATTATTAAIRQRLGFPTSASAGRTGRSRSRLTTHSRVRNGSGTRSRIGSSTRR